MITVFGKQSEDSMKAYKEAMQAMYAEAAQFLQERPQLQKILIMALVSDAIHQTLINNKR